MLTRPPVIKMPGAVLTEKSSFECKQARNEPWFIYQIYFYAFYCYVELHYQSCHSSLEHTINLQDLNLTLRTDQFQLSQYSGLVTLKRAILYSPRRPETHCSIWGKCCLSSSEEMLQLVLTVSKEIVWELTKCCIRKYVFCVMICSSPKL